MRAEARRRQELRTGATAAAAASNRADSSAQNDAAARLTDRPTAAAAADDDEAAADDGAAMERRAKEVQRDRAMRRVLSAPALASPQRALGLPAEAAEHEVMQAVRLAMRLLHPDRGMNLTLRGSPKGRELENAFKRVNNIKDRFWKEHGH